MASKTFSLFGVVRRVDREAFVAEQSIAPRYATFHKICNYIGLRTTPQEAWYRVQQKTEETMKPNEYWLFKATFTEEGFMHYMTKNASPGLPFLHKVLFNDGQEWNCWHFNGPLPLKADCPEKAMPLVHVDFLEFTA